MKIDPRVEILRRAKAGTLPLNIAEADAPIVKDLIKSEHLTTGINVSHLRSGLVFLESPIITAKGDEYLRDLEKREQEASFPGESQKHAPAVIKQPDIGHRKPQQKFITWLKEWRRPMVLLTVALVIIGLLTYDDYRRQTKIMETVNQPHLVTTDATFHDIETGKRPYLTMKIQNTGPLPALDVDVPYRLQIGDVGFYHRLGKYTSADRSWGNIGAGKEIPVSLRQDSREPPLTEAIVTELRGTGLKNIKVHGRIGYESDLASSNTRTKIWAYIRLTTTGPRIQIPFCYEFDPRENAAVICNTGVFDGGN